MKAKCTLLIAVFYLISIDSYAQIDYNAQVQTILTTRCAGCHGGTSGISLNNYTAVMNSVGNQYGRLIVVPFEPEQSPLYDKLLPNPEFGNQMPQGGSLTSEQVETIRLWIEEGATEMPATSIGQENDNAQSFALLENYPNPFNPSTNIRYTLAEPAQVTLDIFNLSGQKVATVVNSFQSDGFHTAVFAAQNLPSGMYVYRLKAVGSANTFIQTQKMTLMK